MAEEGQTRRERGKQEERGAREEREYRETKTGEGGVEEVTRERRREGGRSALAAILLTSLDGSVGISFLSLAPPPPPPALYKP